MRTAPDKPFINYGDTLFTIGVPGSGKTYTQELLIHRLSERNSRTNVLILTPHCAHEYASLMRAHGGQLMVAPHITQNCIEATDVEEHFRKSIARKQSGLFCQLDIGTEAGSWKEVQQNAWLYVNLIIRRLLINSREKYILAIDDADVLLKDSMFLFERAMINLMRTANYNKNCIVLVAGNLDKDYFIKGQGSLLLDEASVSILSLADTPGSTPILMNASSNRRVALNVSQNEHDICSNASYWADVISVIKSTQKGS